MLSLEFFRIGLQKPWTRDETHDLNNTIGSLLITWVRSFFLFWKTKEKIGQRWEQTKISKNSRNWYHQAEKNRWLSQLCLLNMHTGATVCLDLSCVLHSRLYRAQGTSFGSGRIALGNGLLGTYLEFFDFQRSFHGTITFLPRCRSRSWGMYVWSFKEFLISSQVTTLGKSFVYLILMEGAVRQRGQREGQITAKVRRNFAIKPKWPYTATQTMTKTLQFLTHLTRQSFFNDLLAFRVGQVMFE